MAGAASIFAGDKLLTTPNPEVSEDMELFNILGLEPMKPFTKHPQPETKPDSETMDSSTDASKTKWSRPAHHISANVEYTQRAKEKRATLKSEK